MRVLLLLLLASTVTAQRTTYKFDFGDAQTAKGWIPITPDSVVTWKSGYGFNGSQQLSIVHTSSQTLTGDHIVRKDNWPLGFLVRLPEGNYDIKVVLPPGRGTNSIRTECRRLMRDVQQRPFQPVTKTITVHLRDSLIRDAHGSVTGCVKLKPRERSYFHWDSWLMLEFNGGAASAVEIKRNTAATTIFLAGNSTVVDQANEPWASWGQMIPAFFEGRRIAVANYGESGETMKAFIAERRLEKIFSMAKPGDYLFIEFAHNDQKPGGNHLDPFTTYKQTLKEWITAARRHQMIPVLVTSTCRRKFELGRLVNTLGDYPEAMRQTATEEKVALIDLNAMSKALFERLGPEDSRRAFVHFPANTFPGQPTELKDDTHFSPYGAYELARCMAKGIKDAKLPIAKYLRKMPPAFDFSQPDYWGKWRWTPSPSGDAVPPDGN